MWDRTTIFENRIAPSVGFDFSAAIVQCASCDSVYAGSALSAEDLNRYYASVSKYDTVTSHADISPLDRERATLATAFLGPVMDSLASIIDVGCSSGVLLHEFREAGIAQVRGIDPADNAAAVAHDLFDIDVAQADAESFNDYGSFDLVCLMAVLEHLRDPVRLVREIGRQLKPGARLLVEVPDAGAFDRPGDPREFEPYGEFSNEHINFFSIADIRRIALRAGLEVERWMTARVAQGSPDLFVLLRRGAGGADGLPAPVSGSTPSRVSSAEAVQSYVSRSHECMQGVETKLAAAAANQVLIYGAGNHTARLLANSASLARAGICAVFDRNPHLHGATIGGCPILPPSGIVNFPAYPIIISTYNARHEIRDALRGITRQPVVLLYD